MPSGSRVFGPGGASRVPESPFSTGKSSTVSSGKTFSVERDPHCVPGGLGFWGVRHVLSETLVPGSREYVPCTTSVLTYMSEPPVSYRSKTRETLVFRWSTIGSSS